MLLQALIFSVGLGLLYLGAEWLVRGAASLALHFGIRPLVVGLTVVALGTSMPEFLINFVAVLSEQDGLALGNIVGSNICNIALILGMSSIVLPMSVAPGTLRKEYPIMMAVMLVFYGISLDGVIDTFDGILLLSGLAGFLLYLVADARRHASRRLDAEELDDDVAVEAPPKPPTLRKVLLLVGGMATLFAGARIMVYAAVNAAEALGISPVVVGLTVVAIGTSLPELAASMVCAFKKEPDMSVGNVMGSNLLNVLFVVGFVSLIRPLTVDAEALRVHFPVMIGFTLLLLPLAWTQYRITRMEGSLLLAGFVGYMAYVVMPYV